MTEATRSATAATTTITMPGRDVSPDILVDLFNHIAFPPKLPGRRDKEPAEVEYALITRLLHAVRTLQQLADDDMKHVWQFIQKTLHTSRDVNEEGMVGKDNMLEAFNKLDLRGAIIVNIGEQNAALLIRKAEESDEVIFEAFETSPSAEQTLAASGALKWQFPGTAVSLPYQEFKNPVFQQTLTQFLEDASIEGLDEFAAKTRKAGKEVVESRDTVDPAIVTDFLITLLGANGRYIYPPLLCKRIKDDVCWDNAELPWRRSPFWLMLRVCIQRLLYLRLGDVLGRLYYKFLLSTVIAHLLKDLIDLKVLAPEQWSWLNTKLCRRLAKLETETEASSPAVKAAHSRLSREIGPLCERIIGNTKNAISNEWEAFKRGVQRRIPPLLPYARDKDLILTLPNSFAYLQNVLNSPRNNNDIRREAGWAALEKPWEKTAGQFDKLSNEYSSIAELEMAIESNKSSDSCLVVADQIEDYLNTAGNAHDGDPEQMGVLILNVFDLWVRMDKKATAEFPLLADYHPGFHPKLLDVILLSRPDDLRRLQMIQTHLHDRCSNASMGDVTIFTDPSPECFADRYLEVSARKDLVQLQCQIETRSLAARYDKENELTRVNREFMSLTEKKDKSDCTQRRNPDGGHDIRGCSHCYYIRCRRRLQIGVHEDYLPDDHRMAEKRAIVFELGIPEAFDAYRNVTWIIINRFGPQINSAADEPQMLLRDNKQLWSYKMNKHCRGTFSLASYTKSHLDTHYKWKSLPASPRTVLRPLGMKFLYYDSGRRRWAKDQPEFLTFAHHFALSLPPNLPLSGLYSSPNFAPDGAGPSSYEAFANMRDCPATVTIHEFMANQALMAGKHRRWLSILTELGSSNINLSSLDTMVLLRHLALQAGPGRQDDPLRVVHTVFNDADFCGRLVTQIDQHVSIIAPNWRETTYMETLLTLAIQACNLGGFGNSGARHLLLKIRRVTLEWIDHLRLEARNATEVDVAERAARYCFLAALLCRRTFAAEHYINSVLDEESAQDFFEATLTMQESLVVDMSKFSDITRSMLIRDIKASVRLRPVVQAALKRQPNSLRYAIDKVWPSSPMRGYAPWKHMPHPHEFWVSSSITSYPSQNLSQTIHFHLLEGHLLVEGTPLGKLPADLRDSEKLKELFGNQRLIAWPSNQPGMSYTLTLQKEGHTIHLGYRGKDLLIRASKGEKILEHVPRSVFENGESTDLPLPLVHDCVHWLDLRTGILEARRTPAIWKERIGNWKINVRTRKAQRRNVFLVDPHSRLAASIAKIFEHFERPSMLTIYQPPVHTLSVELKRMNLSFHVNMSKHLLQCKQLAAEIDPDQDAGTWYGLLSMLVLRNVHNRSQRSIITTTGRIRYRRHGIHVLVYKENDGEYGRYRIDDVLGRLQGPAEPLQLYTKAQLHAFTSFILPDPLTGRTGTEEALSCLASAYSQPWTPLNKNIVELLQSISCLTPSRQYYPKQAKRQQIVKWNQSLTTLIQHEGYRPVIESILSRSHRLSLFQPEGAPSSLDTATNETHLSERAHWRRSIYERTDTSCQGQAKCSDVTYLSRVAHGPSKRANKVREMVTLIRELPSEIHTADDLPSILKQWPYIGGYLGKLIPSALHEILSIDLAVQWGNLVRLCKECKTQDAYSLMFYLGLMAYGDNVDMRVIRVLAAFFILDDLKKLSLPELPSFENFHDESVPEFGSILEQVKPFQIEYKPPIQGRKKGKRGKASVEGLEIEIARMKHETESGIASVQLSSFLYQQWPCAEPAVKGFSSEFLDVEGAVEDIRHDWLRQYKNRRLTDHLEDVQEVLDAHSAAMNKLGNLPKGRGSEAIWTQSGSSEKPTVQSAHELFFKQGPQLVPNPNFLLEQREPSSGLVAHRARKTSRFSAGGHESFIPGITEIERIVHGMTKSDCPVRSGYSKDLQLSIDALKEKCRQPERTHPERFTFSEGMTIFDGQIKNARTVVDGYYQQIYNALSAGDLRYRWLRQGGLWPCLTPVTILEQLRTTGTVIFGPNMKEALVSYALAVVRLQRLARMKELHAKGDQCRLDQEQLHPFHAVWDYMAFPDWILLEIDADIQIRQEQVTVALQMVSPSSGSNSVLQMNMGQGKTSVIMPMVASALAHGDVLVRLLVPKALTTQTAQVLRARLGGLVGREIIHIPFSRRTPTTPQVIREYRSLHEETLQRSGIVLGVPEHVLSFKLSGLQRVPDMKIPEAVQMIAIQDWIDHVGRDVLDECDFTLSPKTQLIYPSGSQLVVDGHPDRWEVIMAVLGLVAQHLRDLARELPQSIDVVERPFGAFPLAYLLRHDVEEILCKRIVDDICSGRGSVLPIEGYAGSQLNRLKQFISQETVDAGDIEHLETMFNDVPRAHKRAYLLRGLLVHRILLLCLKKRWNVQYGLHPKRDPVAVPFHAKGVPSDHAEWGHPDVAIIFTCLAFYHEGLSQAQTCQCLKAVLKSDDPVTEYDRWTHASAALPEGLRHWNLINVDDQGQVAEIWHHLRFSTTVINYFLKSFVFPVHAKQFAVKLQTSGWDVPFFGNSSVVSQSPRSSHAGLTTGFSGTNDNRRLLPLTIEQHDLPELLHTNAEVLTYLLQKRNRGYRPAVINGRRLSEAELLNNLTESGIRVLIDAGAFILEMDNRTLVKTWLEKDSRAQAAVYFGDDNKAWVQYQTGRCLPLIATPFADHLKDCLIYLDEAHTRGTDLKLPADAKGALTLGLNQTKDHTVQAAMRLRQLGTTQSIIFIAPPEVHRSILDVCQKKPTDKVDSSDVVQWLLHQTCVSNRELEPLFYAQGVDFCHRIQAATDYPDFLHDRTDRSKYMNILQQPEQQTLEQLYRPRVVDIADGEPMRDSNSILCRGKVSYFMQELQNRRGRSNVIQNSITSSALEEVEQEREVAYEVEDEREVQRPGRLQPYRFPGLHPTLSRFVETGLLEGSGTLPAADVLDATTIARKHGIKSKDLLPHLHVSIEFTRTVKLRHGKGRDEFMRPVNWILCNTNIDNAIVIIPEEAEALIPLLRTAAAPSTHLLTYAAPATKRMLHFDRLDYCTVPPLPTLYRLPSWLSFELGILAGRLYFEYDKYHPILQRLQLEPKSMNTSQSVLGGSSNQLGFLQEWLAARRQGQDISHTPMGYVCQRSPLRVDHPFFLETKAHKSIKEMLRPLGQTSTRTEEEYYDSEEEEWYETKEDHISRQEWEKHHAHEITSDGTGGESGEEDSSGGDKSQESDGGEEDQYYVSDGEE